MRGHGERNADAAGRAAVEVMGQPLAIAGGGIAGFATALALANKGLDAIVLEKAADLSEIGAGIQIAPNAFAMFAALGVRAAIDDVAVFPDALVMKDALDGEVITRIAVNSPGFRRRFRHPYAVIYRPDLHQALIDAAIATGRVEVRTSARVESFHESDDDVRIALADGGELTAPVLIGADGLWSAVRQGLLGDGPPRVSGHIAYRAVLPTKQVPQTSLANEVVLWAGPRTHLVHYPLHRGDIYNLVAVFHSDRYEEGWDVFGDVDELNDRFAGQCPAVLDMLARIDAWRMWVLCDREPVRRWNSRRVVLVGDAAHPMLQYLAQGACMAMEDAVCLAERLAALPGDPQAAFAAYRESRYLRTARVQLTARLFGDIYHASDASADLRKVMLSKRTSEQAWEGTAWLYEGVADDGSQIL